MLSATETIEIHQNTVQAWPKLQYEERKPYARKNIFREKELAASCLSDRRAFRTHLAAYQADELEK